MSPEIRVSFPMTTLEDDSVFGIVAVLEIYAGTEREVGLGKPTTVIVGVGIGSGGRYHAGSAAI